MLSNGNQQFQFTPYASGNYNITSQKPVSIYYENEKINLDDYDFNVTLTEGLNYKIVITSERAIELDFLIEFSPPVLSIGNSTIEYDNEPYKFYVLNGAYEYYNIQTDDMSLHIKIYNNKQEILQETVQSGRFYSENKKLYVQFGYSSAKTQTLNIICNQEKELVFISNDISVPAQTIVNGEITSLPVPVREGFIFDGWYLNSSFDGDLATIDKIMQVQFHTVTLYAKWTIDNDYTFSITLYAINVRRLRCGFTIYNVD